jgi:hypothetical protein
VYPDDTPLDKIPGMIHNYYKFYHCFKNGHNFQRIPIQNLVLQTGVTYLLGVFVSTVELALPSS